MLACTCLTPAPSRIRWSRNQCAVGRVGHVDLQAAAQEGGGKGGIEYLQFDVLDILAGFRRRIEFLDLGEQVHPRALVAPGHCAPRPQFIAREPVVAVLAERFGNS